MKRLLGIAAALFFCLWLPVLPARADYVYDETLSELLDLGEGEMDFLPDGADLSDPSSLTQEGTRGFLQKAAALLVQEAQTPLRTLSLLLGVILLSALAQSLRQGQGTGTVYECICTLCAVGIISEPLIAVFERAAAVLSRTSDFMLGFTGLYGGVIAVSGGVSTAALYQGSMAVLCEVALELSAKLLFPLLSMCLAMSIVDAVNPAVSLAGLIGMIRKFAAWILGLLMAGFLGMLSVQSLVTAAADRAGTKAAKYVISGFVPIVGGAVSDAYAAVLGSMGVLRSGVGLAGILMLLSFLLPVVLSLGLYRALVLCASAVSELFDVPVLTRLFKNLEGVLSVGFSAAVSFSVMFIFSTAVLMLIASGAVQT